MNLWTEKGKVTQIGKEMNREWKRWNQEKNLGKGERIKLRDRKNERLGKVRNREEELKGD